jgi:flagellar basal body rod protein FlgB
MSDGIGEHRAVSQTLASTWAAENVANASTPAYVDGPSSAMS